MYRRSTYEAIGGYNENLKYREDYDFWLRFTRKFKVYNINIPLIYYRQHEVSMSKNVEQRMHAHRQIKSDFVERYKKLSKKKIVALIPAAANSRIGWQIPLKQLNNKPLLYYTIEEAFKSELLSKVIVSTEDKKIASVTRHLGADVMMRSKDFTATSISFQDVAKIILKRLKKTGFNPDVVVFLQVVTPFRKAHHIIESINTLLMHDLDSVISVVEDLTFHWHLGEYGLKPVGYRKRLLRQEKEKVYKENGAIYTLKSSNIFLENMLGKKVGYIEMQPYESVRLESNYDFWVAEQMIAAKKFC
jgi:N-acylneuraminate cytidylyltransferase